MKYSNILGAVLLSLTLCFIGCSKEAPMGPEGPQGEQGDPGPKGSPGEPGDNGDEGSAAIIVSDWQSVSFQGSARSWTGIIEVPEITQDILDKADIAVFYKESTGDIHELNYFSAVTTGFDWINQEITLGEITLNSSLDASSAEFRYIIIPGGSKITSLSGSKPTYEALTLKYGIRD